MKSCRCGKESKCISPNVEVLLWALQRSADAGCSVLTICHRYQVRACGDWWRNERENTASTEREEIWWSCEFNASHSDIFSLSHLNPFFHNLLLNLSDDNHLKSGHYWPGESVVKMCVKVCVSAAPEASRHIMRSCGFPSYYLPGRKCSHVETESTQRARPPPSYTLLDLLLDKNLDLC